MVDQNTLEPIKIVTTLERFPVPYLMLTDGEQIAQVLWHTGQLPVKLAGSVLNLWIQTL